MTPAFDITSVTLHTVRGTKSALVATPRRHLRIRDGDFPHSTQAPVPEALALEARKRRGDAKLMIFRGKDDTGAGSWGLHEDLDEGRAATAGEELIHWHLPTWRSLATDGLVLLIHLDLDERTKDALEGGKRVVARELRLKSRTEGTLMNDLDEARARLDLWLLQHLIFFFGLSYGRAMKSTLPDMMPMLEQRQVSLERLLAGLHPEVLKPGA